MCISVLQNRHLDTCELQFPLTFVLLANFCSLSFWREIPQVLCDYLLVVVAQHFIRLTFVDKGSTVVVALVTGRVPSNDQNGSTEGWVIGRCANVFFVCLWICLRSSPQGDCCLGTHENPFVFWRFLGVELTLAVALIHSWTHICLSCSAIVPFFGVRRRTIKAAIARVRQLLCYARHTSSFFAPSQPDRPKAYFTTKLCALPHQMTQEIFFPLSIYFILDFVRTLFWCSSFSLP